LLQCVETDRVIDTILNEQSLLLWEWRTQIIQLLSQKLSPGEGEADGQEYQRTLDNQGEAEIYLQLYAALLADRREALLHERTLLALHDVREKKLRQTAAAIKATTALEELTSTKSRGLEIPNEVVLQPEHEITHAELSLKRKAILQKLGNKALRTVIHSSP
jgi:E3 ubiquitin-protein ligase SHPRH